jgi:hypothetical protein
VPLSASGVDALYFRVSSDRQTTENQFDELIATARAGDPGRDWNRIRSELGRSVVSETRTTRRGSTRTVYRVDETIAKRLAEQCIYVEQGKSGAAGHRRPLFERMRKDAALRRFERLLVWKVTRLGRDMRDVISTVNELADLGITIVVLQDRHVYARFCGEPSTSLPLMWPTSRFLRAPQKMQSFGPVTHCWARYLFARIEPSDHSPRRSRHMVLIRDKNRGFISRARSVELEGIRTPVHKPQRRPLSRGQRAPGY